ncbi:MAG TPA: dienelactone hydrolase family protein [Burkholderiaceae bacterium]
MSDQILPAAQEHAVGGDQTDSPHRPRRREFVKTSLVAGFAAAATPINVRAVIQTDAAGLMAGDIRIPVNRSYQMPGYRAQPAAGSGLPTILVVHEIFGVHEHIRDVCRRFAKLGYMAVAPDLFSRHGNAAAVADMNALIRQVVSRASDSEVLSDLDATATWAATHGGDPARQGVTGFCWGGRITWLYAAHQPKLKAAVAWYGRLVGEETANQPTHPLDVATSLKVPVLGLYGGEDSGIPLDTIERMKLALASAKAPGSESQFVIYPKASHAFFADYRSSYHEASAKDGWSRCLDWFANHGLS